MFGVHFFTNWQSGNDRILVSSKVKVTDRDEWEPLELMADDAHGTFLKPLLDIPNTLTKLRKPGRELDATKFMKSEEGLVNAPDKMMTMLEP